MKDDKQGGEEWVDTPGHWLSRAGFGRDYQLTPLAGGDINDTALLTTASGKQFCIKQNDAAPEDFFAAEAAGLSAIAETDTLRVPRVIFPARRFLLLEYLPAARKKGDYWEKLGQGLAQMHCQKRKQFGFHCDNYCGLSPQRNLTERDGHVFYREHRILFQARLAVEKGLLGIRELKLIERFATRLTDLVPEQAPALIHGDLWSGNVHVDESGDPVLIDPAAYWGWPEADIAMTLLFGGFSESFYQSYLACNPLESGWRDRAPIYNVYHLLNHLNLFGGSYGSQLLATVKRFV